MFRRKAFSYFVEKPLQRMQDPWYRYEKPQNHKKESDVTGKGATITSPETLIAEFQHRYFDLRDGTAVAELWDDGYTAEGFQATIDQSLKGVDDVQWCVTVMPGSKGWWVTEVKWWEPGDINPHET